MTFIPIEDSFVIKSQAMLEVYREIYDYAFHDRSCIFLGATGVGKEYAARYYYEIWLQQKNENKGFRALNCSVFNETLAHSELFGHVKGAFTGATRDKDGFFKTSADGVLFLDEIGDLPLAVQPMLLRALDSHKPEALPLGGEKPYSTANVRVLSATERPLEEIRPALVHRLGKIVFIPSLDDRPEDRDAAIPFFILNALIKRRDLFSFYKELYPNDMRAYTAKTWKTSKLKDLSQLLGKRLQVTAATRQWPGNFRALRIAIDTAIVRSPKTKSIDDFIANADHFFKLHLSTYSQPGSGRSLLPVIHTQPDRHPDETPLYRRIDQALSSASDEEKQQWTMWLENHHRRSFRVAELTGKINSLKQRTLQLRVRALINAGLLRSEEDRRHHYRVVDDTPATMATSAKRFQELFPLPAAANANPHDPQLQPVLDTLSNARHVFLGAQWNGSSSLPLALGHRLANERTIYYARLQEGGLQHRLDQWAEWLISQSKISRAKWQLCQELPLDQSALLLTGFVESHLALDTSPLFILDGLGWAATAEEKDALETVLRFWDGLQLMVFGLKLGLAPEVVRELGVVEI